MNLQGKVALIVGGTRGIGKATAHKLVELGADVVIVGRNSAVGEAAARELGASVRFMQADVSRMREVRRVADAFRASHTQLHILIHSADVLRLKRSETDEGHEVSFATNYLSRFLVNSLLLDLLKASAPSRIVHIAAAGFPGKLDPRHFPPAPDASSFTGHNIGQRANDVYAIELAERLRGSAVTVNVMNPGMVDTDIRRNGATGGVMRFVVRLMEALSRRSITDPAQYANHVLTVAGSDAFAGVTGQLIDPKGRLLRIPVHRLDRHIRDQVWARTEQLVGMGAAPASNKATHQYSTSKQSL